MNIYRHYLWIGSHRSASRGDTSGVCLLAFEAAALSTAVLSTWPMGPIVSMGLVPVTAAQVVAMGIACQWLLGSMLSHFVHTRYGQDRIEQAHTRLWSGAAAILIGAVHGWSCAIYLGEEAFRADLMWGFPAYLALGSVIPSVIYLSLTREKQRIEPPACPACGYILFYTTQQRCPECGRAFHLREINTSAVCLDEQGVLQPIAGAFEQIHWPVASEIRQEHNLHRMKHAIAVLMILTYALLIFDVVAPKFTCRRLWLLYLILAAVLIVQSSVIVIALYQEVRRRVLRHGRRGVACLVVLVGTWIALLHMAMQMTG